MNEAIIAKHNAIVGADDTFYYLGDLCFDNKEDWHLSRLNGKKFFIRGNHDRHGIRKAYARYGTYLGDFAEVEVEGKQITLCHYALRVWNKSHRGSWSLYGHSHGSLPDDPNSLSFDVGTMMHNYEPLSFEQVEKIMSKKTWKPKDHHGAERRSSEDGCKV
jgi:calcineurin-like phosphoesterase family protein